MSKSRAVPVPTGRNYPGAGGRLRLTVFADGREGQIKQLEGTRIGKQQAETIGRVMGKIIAGLRYPLHEDMVVEGWVRETRRGFLKLDFPPATIVCAASLKGNEIDRILKGLVNSQYMAKMAETLSSVMFIPIVLAGVSKDTIYYVETPDLPEFPSSDLVLDSVRFCHFLVHGAGTPFDLDDRAAYAQSLKVGDDPHGLLSFEPFLRSRLEGLEDEARREFIAQVGAEIELMHQDAARVERTEPAHPSARVPILSRIRGWFSRGLKE
jgi:hypothetical protein